MYEKNERWHCFHGEARWLLACGWRMGEDTKGRRLSFLLSAMLRLTSPLLCLPACSCAGDKDVAVVHADVKMGSQEVSMAEGLYSVALNPNEAAARRCVPKQGVPKQGVCREGGANLSSFSFLPPRDPILLRRPVLLYFGGGWRLDQQSYSGGARQAYHKHVVQTNDPRVKTGGDNTDYQ